MPYTRDTEQTPFAIPIRDIAENITGPGDLTYVVCMLMWRLWQTWGPSFRNWCLIRCSVEEAVSDFRDRHISVLNFPKDFPGFTEGGYEWRKLQENGDVYD